uniref:SWIM-type domain-containing protein n=1 Tax=Steinernema glaseri TaxID=37863 RepID=A0A1I8AW32_9BILA
MRCTCVPPMTQRNVCLHVASLRFLVVCSIPTPSRLHLLSRLVVCHHGGPIPFISAREWVRALRQAFAERNA